MSDFQAFSTFTPSANEGPAINPNAVRINSHSGTTAISISGDTATDTSSSRSTYSTGQIGADQHGADSWQATARHNGMPARTINGETVVTVGGVQGRVQDFVSAGMLHETTTGQYSETPQAEPQGWQQESAQDPDQAVMPDELTAAVNDVLQPFSDNVVQVGVAQATIAAIGDGSLDNVAATIARSSGMEPGEAMQRAQFAVNAYQAQADQYLTANIGIEAEDLFQFYADLKLGNKSGLKDAIGQQINGNSMKAWKALGQQWLSNTSPSSEALQRAGLTVRGEEVQIGGNWHNIKAAARAGLI